MPDSGQRPTPPLLRRDENGVAWLTLNRPSARNALSRALMAALERELEASARIPRCGSS